MVRVYVPAVKLKLIELASLREPVDTVVATAPAYVTLTTGVPDTVRLLLVAAVQSVPPAPLTVILPVPKAMERMKLPVATKNPVVSVKLLRLSVPASNVVVCVALTVIASCRTHDPPRPLKNTGTFSVLPLEVIVLPAVVLAKTHVLELVENVAVEPKFALP